MNIDSDLRNADWVKQSWPFVDRPLAEWGQMAREDLAILVALPVWRHAPDDVRQVVEARLSPSNP